MDWLHRFLVPSEKNGYRPTSLESTAAGIMLLLIVLTFALANVQSILLVSSDWFVSTILPAALVDLTNDNRDDNALPTLKRNPLLDEAAALKAKDMAAKSYFSHDSPDGVTPWYWFKEVGYTYAYAGENLAVHFSDSEDVVEAWMKSPGHRANILGDDYQEIGIGTAKGTYKGTPTVFVVQLFGTPLESMVELPVEEKVVVDTPTVRVPTESEVLAVRDRTAPPPPPSAPVEKSIVAEAPVAPELIEELPESTPIDDSETASTTNQAEQDESMEDDQLTVSSTTLVARSSEPTTALEPETLYPLPRSGQIVYTSMATTAAPSTVSLRQGPIVSAGEGNPVASFFSRLLSSPHTFISLSYLILTFVVATMLAFSVVVEWRRQHPIQVAYAVGLAGVMLLTFKLHIALTAGALIM